MTTMLMEPLAPWLRDLNRLFAGNAGGGTFIPPIDVLVTEEEVKVNMDVPGVRSEQLEIELENDTLSIRGERPYPYDNAADGWARLERTFGRFERQVRVPRGLKPDTIEA